MTKKAKLKKDYIYLDNEESIDTVIQKDTELNYVKNYYEFKNDGVKIRVPESLVRNNLEYFEIIKEYDRNWKPEKIAEKYWFEDTNGDIQQAYYGRHSADRHRIQQVPIFSSKEEAVQWQKAKNTLYDLRYKINGDWVPNWEDEEVKYYLVFKWDTQECRTDYTYYFDHNNDLWFKENPKYYCLENGLSWYEIKEAFKIYIRVE